MKNCKNCSYFLDYKYELLPGTTEGECRRYPPVKLINDEAGASDDWGFPVVFSASVCGEHKSDQTHDVVRHGTPIASAGLSGLLRNSLRQEGFITVEEAQENLRNSVQKRCLRLGAKTLKELEDWGK